MPQFLRRIFLVSSMLSVMILVFSCCGQSNNAEKYRIEWNSGLPITQELQVEKQLNTLIKALKEKDSETIKSLFSKGVRAEVGDSKMEYGAEYLISYFEGDVISVKEITTSTHTTSDIGERRVILGSSFTINTTADTFRLFFYYHISNSINSEYNGMYQLSMEKVTDEIKGGMRPEFVGIYVPRKIDVADKNIPHKYSMPYGTFTVPAGYYLDESISTDEKYYFSIESVNLSDCTYNNFSISLGQSDYGLDEFEVFRDSILPGLRERRIQSREPFGGSYSDGTILEETQGEKTKQGYVLLKYSFVTNGRPQDKFYYIVGDKKYILVQYSYAGGYIGGEPEPEETAMIAAAESLVDSFVWAE